ncbi:ribosome production factor 2 homolog [Crotalus tigris]|uniref:ribosome production factor 2 homolog n=1 Tax=Crotalus tigris TaxID=88082 RepID=UPI00192FAC0E|nr:ribosome production factor 2 homolog [Crotalus tigris]
MEALDRVVKPKTKRAKRFLEKREPKLTENTKNAMLIKGGNASLTVTEVLKNIYALKKPFAVLYKKKNITRPFEDQSSLEFFSKKSDCSLFLFGSHSKKRPNNLIVGRMYDYHVLDMIELGIEKFVPLRDIKNSKCPEGTKPMLIFAGDAFDLDEEHRRLKSLLIDFFRGPVVPSIRLAGLEHVLHFTAVDEKIYMRSYKVLLKKSGCKIPRIELEDMGPSLDLVIRRTHLASDDLFKLSLKQPKALKPKKKKNVSHDVFGTKYGRIHMQKQDLDKLQTRKMKGLKKRRSEKKTEDGGDPKKLKLE